MCLLSLIGGSVLCFGNAKACDECLYESYFKKYVVVNPFKRVEEWDSKNDRMVIIPQWTVCTVTSTPRIIQGYRYRIRFRYVVARDSDPDTKYFFTYQIRGYNKKGWTYEKLNEVTLKKDPVWHTYETYVDVQTGWRDPEISMQFKLTCREDSYVSNLIVKDFTCVPFYKIVLKGP